MKTDWRSMARRIAKELNFFVEDGFRVVNASTGTTEYAAESWKDACMFLITCDVVKTYTQKYGWN